MVDVAKCHIICHAKRWKMSPSATIATWNEDGCHQVPCVPRETKVDVAKCHACHAKVPRRRRPTAPKRATGASPVPYKCHACHAKRTWMSPNATSATRNDGGCRPSSTPATRNDGGCHQVPHLPRLGDQPRPSEPPEPAQSNKCAPATWNEGGCHQVPHLPRETMVDVAKCHICHAKRCWMLPSARPRETMVDVAKWPSPTNKVHACHAKREWMSPSVTPATRNNGGCHQVPRLPRETTVDVTKC